ncbi:glycosyltransferase family 61 protein [Paenibacillus algorifonticola]|uniref:glycosyltransferase family 61 protein n=1 Tax=Paenibacillus algorifonticola TaxID=684063 RepID=UPI003D2BF611
MKEAIPIYTIPQQFYEKTRDWAQQAAVPPDLLSYYYQVIYPAETLTLPAGKGIDQPRWVTTSAFDEAFLASIPGGRLVTSNAYVVTPDNKRLRDVELDCPLIDFSELPEPQHFKGTVATLIWGWNMPHINACTQNIFGHWFFDLLPRLHLLEKSGISIDKYVIGKLFHPFHYESLAMLGIPLHKCIQVEDADFHLLADRLIVPAVPLMVGKCPPWASHFMAKRLKADRGVKAKKGFERLYITRKDAAARFVTNEDEVLRYLKSKGFREIVLTPLSTAEKIAIFSSAQHIVAPFGSGSINIAFCEPGAALFELAPSTFVDPYFWKLCAHAGVDYYEIVCEVEQPPKPFVGTDNIVVNINKLEHVLKLAGI